MTRFEHWQTCLAAVLLAACVGTFAAADEQPGNFGQPRLLNESAGRGAAYLGEAELRRPVDASAEAAQASRFPVKFQRAQHQSTIEESVLPADAAPSKQGRADRELPLTPPARSEHSAGRGDPALLTGAASLGIVLGLFLLVAWAVRRGMPKNAALLPREAVEVLGRTALVGRQHVHLVRCGNKVLLLDIAATGVKTLTEITDADEVERLTSICQSMDSRGTSASFRQVFGKFSGASRGPGYPMRPMPEDLEFGEMADLRGQESHV